MDASGTKYTLARTLAFLAGIALSSPLFAQTPYPPSYAALNNSSSYADSSPTASPTASTNDDPQAGAMLTIHKRVDEVNVLFIATDKHGKFVRDLNQQDFSILDDHKPPLVDG